PLYPVLRGEVARYGELVGACYAALEEDPSLPRYMNCKYGKLQMLEDAGAGYEVTRYIYSSPPCRAWRRRTADAPAGPGTLRMGSALALLLAYDLVELGIAGGAAAAAWSPSSPTAG
uniref:Uncharacterized protein n=1 Tax=Oryza glaberrima TaxID=4538 RepID=I1R024_ORYGL